MLILFYRFMFFMARSRYFIWLVEFITWCIVTVYFLMPRPQVGWSMDFYRALFPGRSRLYYLMLAWRQFHHFSTVFTDRMIIEGRGDIPCESVGSERIHDADAAGKRGILLMSHVGNWELAALKLAGLGLRVAIFAGMKQAQKIEAMMKREMLGKGLSIITVGENEEAPLNVLDALNFVRNEGFISMAGDRLWSPAQKYVEVDFLGKKARIPQTPFAMAYAMNVPLFVFFIIRTGRARYRIEYNPPIIMDRERGTGRDDAIMEAASAYMAMLEDVVRRHPEHWYCFEPFLIEETEKG
jgi:predicted LPLAT superfamily acyltransferase